MIHVTEQIESPDFNASVRVPGRRFLNRYIGRPLLSKDFQNHWSNCLRELRIAYMGICAYTASYVPLDIANSVGSVDHFIGKTTDRELAYEWTNYRFCTPRVNTNKGNSERVMDPFHITNGWFILDFDSYLVMPASDLPEFLETSVQNTIDDLKLNDDDNIAQARADQVQEYIDGHVTFDFLERKYPFIAMELTRQRLQASIKLRTRKTPVIRRPIN